VGVSRDCPIFSGTPIISGTGKTTNKFCMHIYRLNRNKSPLKILRKIAMGVVRDSRKFSGHPYIGRMVPESMTLDDLNGLFQYARVYFFHTEKPTANSSVVL